MYFLHELVKSYVADKQRTGAAREDLTQKTSASALDPTAELQKDGREFLCDEWHMEPTVRFLDFAQFEPYGVDGILHRLGFRHARVTIPKWVQRGFMDPLDSVLASLMELVLLMTRKGK